MKYDKFLNERLAQIPCLILYGAPEERLIDIAKDINSNNIFIDACDKDTLKTTIQNTRIDNTTTVVLYNIGTRLDSKVSKINKLVMVMPKLLHSGGLQVYCGGEGEALSPAAKEQVEKLIKCESILELKSGITRLFKAKIELEVVSKYIINKYKIRKTIREIVALAAECTRTRNMNSVEYYLLYERFFIKLRTFL